MEFIKKNYEKIILSAVLLGLVGVLVGMWFVIMADKQKMEDMTNVAIGRPVPLPDLDLSRQDSLLDRLKQPYDLDFSETNKLFNPVKWQKNLKDGTLIKIANSHTVGPNAAVVAKITPLYFSIALVSVDTNGVAPSYKISVEHQAAPAPAQRRPQSHYASLGEKVNGVFKLDKVNGPPEDPTELILTLPDGQKVTVGKDQPYRQVEGYTADLRYDPEKLTFNGQRVGDQLNFANDSHNIVAIDQNEVVLLAQSNQKKYVLRYGQ